MWQLGCDDLNGDRATEWLCCMFCHLLFLPFYSVFISGVLVGLFLYKLSFSSVQRLRLDDSPVAITGIVGLSILFMPIQAIVLAFIFPMLIVTRLYQIIKMFFKNIAGTCCLGCCKCCCFWGQEILQELVQAWSSNNSSITYHQNDSLTL